MVSLIIACIITLSVIGSILFAWIYYQQARNKERMILIEKGERLEDIFQIQKKNKFEFIFPWLKLGIVIIGMSIAFLLIGFLVLWLENDNELFKGFLITFILGICMGASMLINHFVGRKKVGESQEHG